MLELLDDGAEAARLLSSSTGRRPERTRWSSCVTGERSSKTPACSRSASRGTRRGRTSPGRRRSISTSACSPTSTARRSARSASASSSAASATSRNERRVPRRRSRDRAGRLGVRVRRRAGRRRVARRCAGLENVRRIWLNRRAWTHPQRRRPQPHATRPTSPTGFSPASRSSGSSSHSPARAYVPNNWYALFKAIHVMFAVVWVGGGVSIMINGIRAQRTSDPRSIVTVAQQAAFLGEKIFAPAGLVVFLMGIAMMINTNWGWSHFWIVLGLDRLRGYVHRRDRRPLPAREEDRGLGAGERARASRDDRADRANHVDRPLRRGDPADRDPRHGHETVRVSAKGAACDRRASRPLITCPLRDSRCRRRASCR